MLLGVMLQVRGSVAAEPAPRTQPEELGGGTGCLCPGRPVWGEVGSLVCFHPVPFSGGHRLAGGSYRCMMGSLGRSFGQFGLSQLFLVSFSFLGVLAGGPQAPLVTMGVLQAQT